MVGSALQAVFVVVDLTRGEVPGLERILRAVQAQLREDVAPAWGLSQDIKVISSAARLEGDRVLWLRDRADAPGPDGLAVLGRHMPDGTSVVYVDPPDMDKVSAVISHELIEALVDPTCGLWVRGPATDKGGFYAREACDPVQGLTYEKSGHEGVRVADFVLPSYFDASLLGGSGGGRYDWMGQCPAPFSLPPSSVAPQAYQIVSDGRGTSTVFGFAAQLLASQPRALGRAAGAGPAMASAHFAVHEFDCHDGTPYPPEWVDSILRPLCEQVLEPIRANCCDGHPLVVLSGFRSLGYDGRIYERSLREAGAGGVVAPPSRSQHPKGHAADVSCPGVPADVLHARVLAMQQSGALPLLGGLGRYPTFIHVDTREWAGHLAQWDGARTSESA